MLGAARASEYARWWRGGLTSIVFNGFGAVNELVAYDPAYSMLLDGTNSALDLPDAGYRGSYDITGLTGFTGYNGLKHTSFAHYYFPSSIWTSGFSDGDTGLLLAQTMVSGLTTNNFNFDLALSSGCFRFQGVNGTRVSTPTAYTNWTDTWLTLIQCTSNSSSDFTNWTGTGSGNTYMRIALFNTQTGALIAKTDSRFSTSWIDFSTLPSTLPQYDAGNSYLSINNGPYANRGFRMAGLWNTWGQMFDPLTTTDTSWLTTAPSKEISNAKAWTNSQFIRVGRKSNTDPDTWYITALGQDLYGTSSTQQLTLVKNKSVATFNTLHSTSNIIRSYS